MLCPFSDFFRCASDSARLCFSLGARVHVKSADGMTQVGLKHYPFVMLLSMYNIHEVAVNHLMPSGIYHNHFYHTELLWFFGP